MLGWSRRGITRNGGFSLISVMPIGIIALMTPGKIGRPRARRGPRGKLAEALRAARAARGMTQAEAAEELRIDQAVLARWEGGARQPKGLSRRYLEEVWIPLADREQNRGVNQ